MPSLDHPESRSLAESQARHETLVVGEFENLAVGFDLERRKLLQAEGKVEIAVGIVGRPFASSPAPPAVRGVAHPHEREQVSRELREELGIVVEEALATMSDKLRTVLLLHDKEDMAYEEIAEVLQISIGTVRSRLNRARFALKQQLEKFPQWNPEA